MNLDRVTMTGADDSVSPQSLIELSKEFPFVEWGILISESSTGHYRFPSHGWIAELQSLAKADPIKLSLHVCGKWVRRLLLGHNDIPAELLVGFQRIQLNFHAEKCPCVPPSFNEVLAHFGGVQFIFQIDGAQGNVHLDAVKKQQYTLDAVALFDISGGAGILPTEWPRPMEGFSYHGYAGGLGPANLEAQLPKIAEAAGDARVWIDMETKVRSLSDSLFDLHKVRECLEICKGIGESA